MRPIADPVHKAKRCMVEPGLGDVIFDQDEFSTHAAGLPGGWSRGPRSDAEHPRKGSYQRYCRRRVGARHRMRGIQWRSLGVGELLHLEPRARAPARGEWQSDGRLRNLRRAGDTRERAVLRAALPILQCDARARTAREGSRESHNESVGEMPGLAWPGIGGAASPSHAVLHDNTTAAIAVRECIAFRTGHPICRNRQRRRNSRANKERRSVFPYF